jgi:1,4-dihydroxy-2-naphthoate polyprenyltransferase
MTAAGRLKERLNIFLAIVEIKTKVISVVTFSSAVLYSIYRSGSLPLARFVLMTLAVLMVDMGTTAFNNYFDFRAGVDVPELSRDTDKILMYGRVEDYRALHIALILFAGAAFFGIIISFLSGLGVAVAGAASMAVGFLYNGGKKPISRTPFGELFAGGFLGSVLFLISVYVFTGSVDGEAMMVSLPMSFFVAAVLLVNNTCDIQGDRAAGRRTLPIVLGAMTAEVIIYLLNAAAYLTLGYCVYKGFLPAVAGYTAAAAAALNGAALFTMNRRRYNHETKVIHMKTIVGLYGIFGLQFAAAMIFSIEW